MNEKNQIKLDRAKEFLDKQNIFYSELNNGQLQVDGINFWATSEKWYNPRNGDKGQGINSFVKYLKDQNII